MAEATIRDVAQRARVSIASVSRALNGLHNVSTETRDRVVAAANELGYVPHAGARSLSLARAHAIGVMLPDLHGEFFSEIMRGMDREASARGYLLFLSNMHAGDAHAEQALRTMRGRVDGLLVMAPHLDRELLERALPRSIPAVLVNPPSDVRSHPTIRLDNALGARAVTEHLLSLGRTRLVHIAGPAQNVDAQEREMAFREVMAANARDTRATVVRGDFSEGSGGDAVTQLIQGGVEFDAIFAGNDMMAIGALQALRSAGKQVPEDVAVAGFDDIPMARYLGLTTVSVRIAELGAQAIARLVDMFGRPRFEPSHDLHASELVVRGTTDSGSRTV